jgi:2-succinyl-6-hydroxy-2,4-cyclohexadiene-1-carboxylate synthase
VVGDDALQPLLLLHGFLSSNLQWVLNQEELQNHFQLYLVELWGHGNSPIPKELSYYTVLAYLQQLEGIRADLGIEQWAMIGQSLGAGIILHYASHFPQRCKSVLVTNSMAAFQSYLPKDCLDPQAAVGKMLGLVEEKGVRGLPMHPCHGKRLEPALRRKMVTSADNIAREVVIGHLGMMEQLSLSPKITLDKDPCVSDIDCPVYLANGIYESEFQHAVKRLPIMWPRLHISNMEGGHSVNLDCPKEFNQLAIDSLKLTGFP